MGFINVKLIDDPKRDNLMANEFSTATSTLIVVKLYDFFS